MFSTYKFVEGKWILDLKKVCAYHMKCYTFMLLSLIHVKQHVPLSKAVKKVVTVVKNDRERKRQKREKENENYKRRVISYLWPRDYL